MQITKPIFIRKIARGGYQVTGYLDGYGPITEYGRSREVATERFFEACNKAADGAVRPRTRGSRASYSLQAW